jgi:hypothetical protein
MSLPELSGRPPHLNTWGRPRDQFSRSNSTRQLVRRAGRPVVRHGGQAAACDVTAKGGAAAPPADRARRAPGTCGGSVEVVAVPLAERLQERIGQHVLRVVRPEDEMPFVSVVRAVDAIDGRRRGPAACRRGPCRSS